MQTTNDSHYYGANADIQIEKTTNSQDADSPTGPNVNVGDAITWRYNVTNTGNLALTSVVVSDSDSGVSPTYLSGDNSPANSELDPGETWIYEATGTATAGQYMNTGTVDAETTVSATAVNDSDNSHYFGVNSGVNIDKVTNGADGQNIAVGDPITWTYTVTNSGNVALDTVSVSDDQEGPATYISGDTDTDNELDTNETWIYQIIGTAASDSYNNTGSVSAQDTVLSNAVSDNDDSDYFGVDASVAIDKVTNGTDGSNLAVGTPITWTYTVTNTGKRCT